MICMASRSRPFLPTEKWDLEKSTFKAARLILGNQAEVALPLVEESLRVFPANIQVWINKGMALMQLPNCDLGEIEHIHSMFVELKAKKAAELEAKVYHTYFIWDFPVSDSWERTKESVLTFQEIIEECKCADEDLTEIEMRSSSFCVKNIYRLIRDCECEDWILETGLIQAGFAMLKAMQCTSRKYYQLHSWLWLSEFFQLRPSSEALASNLGSCIDELQSMPSFENIGIEVCVKKALEIYQSTDPENFEPNFDANDFYGRLGKSYYFLALKMDNATKRIECLEKSIELAGRSMEVNQTDSRFVPTQCVKILLNLWAVKYYQRYQEKSWQYYEWDNGKTAKSVKQVWGYLAYGSWHRTAVKISELAEILQQAKTHLKRPCVLGMPIQLPRVMYLLGEPNDKVELELAQLGVVDDQFKVLEFYAQFYEQTRQYDKAVRSCKKALEIMDGEIDSPAVVRRCLRRCSRT
ncbi:uncharacterized protein [Watersipora subatra]|uniref:uncharacterized protein n=1 Tax=Watersipora subatra TaxID=2589382 RepID=UPI00355BBEA2